ncbi:hypothetical protein HY004_01820 [Candidatus Saccharibacteria bacterium]|nr:hypothetical protein [Candidatus Saccharibacteria bacterium]
MDKFSSNKSLIKQLRGYHYVTAGSIIVLAFLFMGISIMQIINLPSDAAYKDKIKDNIDTSFDTKTLQRIGELQYSSSNENTASEIPSRNPFQ